jgi:hypothetical protein
MGEAEPHLQKGFQTNSNPAGTADFTFKTASNIVPPKQQGKYFKASYTKMAHLGKLELRSFTQTQSKDEIEPLLYAYKEVRLNAGQPEYLRHEGDKGGDRVL